MLASAFKLAGKQAAEHYDACCGDPRRKAAYLEPNGDRNLGNAGQCHPRAGIPHPIRDHPNQIRSTPSSMRGSGQQEHRTESGPKGKVPVCEIAPLHADGSEDKERNDETDEGRHARISTLPDCLILKDTEWLPSRPCIPFS